MQYDSTKNASHNNDDLFQAGQAGLYGYDEPLAYLVWSIQSNRADK